MFEEYLRGKKGIKQIDMAVDGTITAEITEEEAIAGSDIVLTIDGKKAKDLEKQNHIQIGDIITTIRNLSNDDDWIECNGQEVDPKKYPKLASLLGNDLFPSEWYIGSRKFNDET